MQIVERNRNASLKLKSLANYFRDAWRRCAAIRRKQSGTAGWADDAVEWVPQASPVSISKEAAAAGDLRNLVVQSGQTTEALPKAGVIAQMGATRWPVYVAI